MKSLNRAELIGNLGNAPEIRATKKGQKVASFRVATNGYNHTEWHNVVVFADGLVDIIDNHLDKGDRIYVAGELRTRSYEAEGGTRFVTELVVNELVLLGNSRSPKATGHNDESQGHSAARYTQQDVDDAVLASMKEF